jgi:hypothetical protein
MLPHVIRFNAGEVEEHYHDLLHESQNGSPLPKLAGGVPGLAEFVSAMLARAGLATTLRPLGVDPLKLPHMAAQAAHQWTATFNPRRVSEEEMLELYQRRFEKDKAGGFTRVAENAEERHDGQPVNILTNLSALRAPRAALCSSWRRSSRSCSCR